MKVLIRTEANKNIGYGHIVRCYILAKELCKFNFTVYLILSKNSEWKQKSINKDINIIQIPDEIKSLPSCEEIKWIEAKIGYLSWFIIDGLNFNLEYEVQAKMISEYVACIDGTLREHNCDLLIDPNIHDVSERRLPQKKLVHILEGEKYLLIDDKYTEISSCKVNSKNRLSVDKILINISGGKFIDDNLIILQAINSTQFSGEVILIGAGAESISEKIKNFDFSYTLICKDWVDNLAEIAAECDMAIGGSGMAAWERCVLGIPSIVFKIADNQKYTLEKLRLENACIIIQESPSRYGVEKSTEEINKLLKNNKIRTALSKKSRSLCDGKGKARIAKKIISLSNQIRIN